jgi:hypothetical protein
LSKREKNKGTSKVSKREKERERERRIKEQVK